MLTAEQAQKYIESKKTIELISTSFESFSKKYAALGALIIRNNYHTDPEQTDRKSLLDQYHELFGDDPLFNPWENAEGLQLAALLYGKASSSYIAKVWDIIHTTPYQKSYSRRSFRAAPGPVYTKNKLGYLQNLYGQHRTGYAQLSMIEKIQYDTYQGYYMDNAYLFAAAYATSDISSELFRKTTDILLGEDNIGAVSRSIIKGLLISENPNHWTPVEKLLLAAQRQEGLRQTILEALDECSVPALEHFIHVILEHELFRFSSVVRAIDTWFGFGWEAPKKNTLKRVLQLAQSCFKKASFAHDSLKSKDNLEVYVALWFEGLKNIDAANLKAFNLLENGDKEKKILSCLFISQSGRTNTRILKWMHQFFGADDHVDYWVLRNSPKALKLNNHLFQKILKYAEETPSTGKKVSGQVFAWNSYIIQPHFYYSLLITNANPEQLKVLAEDISKIHTDSRLEILTKIFPDHVQLYYYYNAHKKKQGPLNLKSEPWKKDLIMQAIKDRNASVMQAGLYLIQHIKLSPDEMFDIEELFARKNKDLRSSLIKLILNQDAPIIERSVTALIEKSKVDQRLAGLELLTHLHQKNKSRNFVKTKINQYRTGQKLSKNEQVFLDKLKPEENTVRPSFQNGFTIVDYKSLRPLLVPQQLFKPKGLLIKANFLFKDLYNIKKIKTAINELIAIFKENQNHEYKITTWNGGTETILLSQSISLIEYNAYKKEPKEQLDYLPLKDIWMAWYERHSLSDFEMLAALYYCNTYPHPFRTNASISRFQKKYIPEVTELHLDKSDRWDSMNRRISRIINFLFRAVKDTTTVVKHQVAVLEDMIFKIPKDQKFDNKQHPDQVYYDTYHWHQLVEQLVIGYIETERDMAQCDLPADVLLKYYDLKMILYAHHRLPKDPAPKIELLAQTKPSEDRHVKVVPPWLIIKLHQLKQINDDDLMYQFLINQELVEILENQQARRRNSHQNIEIHPLAKTVVKPLKAELIALELTRGDLPTEATPHMRSIQTVSGIQYLITVLERLGKEMISRGYQWQVETSKKESFSQLIKKSTPDKNEDLDDFIRLSKATKVTKKRWIEVAMYAPQWADWIGQLLKIELLPNAVWWFHAHTSEHKSAEKETIIAKYSSVEQADFAMGAIDIDWFDEAYTAIGKQNWKLCHDAAKYISHANGHRLIKLYSSVMLGEMKIRETLSKIKDKRDKDYVKALGLVPLSKSNAAKDLLNRYHTLQEFLKESKKFGAQRQESEKRAVTIGMANLARNAGYRDSTRFSWAMEGEATQKIMSQSKIQIDEVNLELVVDDQGRAQILVQKGKKKQKSIPAKIKKHKDVKTLLEHKAYLKKQYSRTRQSLEQAMVLSDEFSAEELNKIMPHPVVRAMLSKLAIYHTGKKTSGFWIDGQLISIDGEKYNQNKTDRFMIAHPSHLYGSAEWGLFQKHLFDQKIIQPFKQVFRELYVVTQNEKEIADRSDRFQGHQIQPKKAVALLRSRGWTVHYETGLQKVIHQKNIIATMYAMADWFSPAELEVPTIEYVAFSRRKDWSMIPLSNVDAITFSEVMRDVDLVVSVAHVGGVDPEASHSTMQMRAALARETARLFKANNIEVLERNIVIKGKLATYGIHLGSGVVSKNGLRLSIIPVHSQHRGRMFLPFIDDDPKTAEIISKMKLLSEDDKIKDPTILAQINVV